MPTTEWLNKYEAIKDKLTCKDDLEAHFTEKVIGNMAVDVLDIGTVHFPTGQIFACDPLVELEDTLPFLQTIPAGTYPVKICVVPSEQYGDRYACVKVEVSREKPVRHELGMVGNDTLPQKSAAAAMTLVLSFTAARDLLEYASQPAALEPAIKRTILAANLHGLVLAGALMFG